MKIDKHYARGQYVNYTATVRPHARAFHTIWWFATGCDWFKPASKRAHHRTRAERKLTQFYYDKVEVIE